MNNAAGKGRGWQRPIERSEEGRKEKKHFTDNRLTPFLSFFSLLLLFGLVFSNNVLGMIACVFLPETVSCIVQSSHAAG